MEPAAAEVEASLAAAHATRRREEGRRAEGRRARGRRGGVLASADAAAEPVVATRRTRDVRLYAGCAGCADADADADADAAAATARGTTRRAARGAARGAASGRMAGWDPATARSARRAEGRATARGSSPPRAPRRRGGARGRAPRRRAASRSRRGHHLVAQPTRADTCLREGDGRERETARRAETRRERSTLAFRSLPKGETCSSCDPPRGMPERVASAAAPVRLSLSRDLRAGPTRQVLLSSWWQRLRRMSRIFLGPGESREPLNSRMTVCFASIADRGSPTGFRTVMRVAVERARTCRTDGCRVARCVAGHFFRSRI